MLIYALVAGVLFGLYFSLVGIGLNLVFGVMRIVNLAHGDFLMLGAFVAFGVVALAGIDPLFAVPLAFAVFVLVGVLLYWVLVPRLQGSVNPEMLSIILFFGLSQVIEAVTTIFFGTSERSIQSRALGTRVLDDQGKLFGGKPDSAGPVQIFGQGFPAGVGDSGHHQPDRNRALSTSILPHPARHLTRAVMSRRDEAVATGIDVDRVSAAAFRHRLGARRCGRRIRTLHVRIGDAGVRSGCDRYVLRHRGAGIAWQSARHRTRRCRVWRLLYAGADLSQFMGRPSALCTLDFHSAAPSERAARKAGARCLVRLDTRCSSSCRCSPSLRCCRASTKIICCCSISSSF